MGLLNPIQLAQVNKIAIEKGAFGITSITLKEVLPNNDTVLTFALSNASTYDLIIKGGTNGVDGEDASEIISANFVGNDLVFTKDDTSTFTIINDNVLLNPNIDNKQDTLVS